MSHLIGLNANYVAKYETEFDVSLRRIKERLEKSQSELTSQSNPDLIQELESAENSFQAGKRKMNERFVRFKQLWTSFRSKTSASNQNQKDEINLL